MIVETKFNMNKKIFIPSLLIPLYFVAMWNFKDYVLETTIIYCLILGSLFYKEIKNKFLNQEERLKIIFISILILVIGILGFCLTK